MPDPITSAARPIPTLELEPVVVTGRATKPAPPPPPMGEIALNCFDEADAVAVALLTRSPPNLAVAVLATVGISYDFAACALKTVAVSEEKASIARAIARCVADGGTAIGHVGNTLTCAVVAGE